MPQDDRDDGRLLRYWNERRMAWEAREPYWWVQYVNTPVIQPDQGQTIRIPRWYGPHADQGTVQLSWGGLSPIVIAKPVEAEEEELMPYEPEGV